MLPFIENVGKDYIFLFSYICILEEYMKITEAGGHRLNRWGIELSRMKRFTVYLFILFDLRIL